jgi:acetyltransferase-like isoleucine patch superfamily enzyme
MLQIYLKKDVLSVKSNYVFTVVKSNQDNNIKIFHSRLQKCRIDIVGNNNRAEVLNSIVSDSDITIKGCDNILLFENNVVIRQSNIQLFGRNCQIHVKKNTIINGIRIVNVGKNNKIEIGENCLFSDHIDIYGSDTHSIYDKEGNCINHEKNVIIEDNVWIGAHVKILKGVTIGEGSVIGMGSIVTKDIAPHTLAAGNPIKVIKENINWTVDYESIKDLDIYGNIFQEIMLQN